MSVLVFQTSNGEVEADPRLFENCQYVTNYLERLGEESGEEEDGKIYIFLKFTDQETFRDVIQFLKAPSSLNISGQIKKALDALEYQSPREPKAKRVKKETYINKIH